MDRTFLIGVAIAVVVFIIVIGVGIMTGRPLDNAVCKISDGTTKDLPSTDWYNETCTPRKLSRAEINHGIATANMYRDLCRCYESFHNGTSLT